MSLKPVQVAKVAVTRGTRRPISRKMFEEVLVLSLAVLASQASVPSKTEEANQTSWTLNDDSWNYWWSYSGVSGPSYWGVLNLDWFVCDKGRRQSPINIDTSLLVYDPHLSPLRADNNLISGLLYNDGHAIVFNASITTPRATKTAETAKTSLLDATTNSKEDQQQQPIQQNGSLVLKRTSVAQEADEGYLFGEAAFFEDPAKLEANILSDFSEARDSSSRNQRMEPSSMDNSLSTDGIVGIGNELDRTGVGENGGESAAEAGSNNQENSNQLDGLDAQDNNNGNNPSSTHVHFTGAGLAYTYRFELLYLRFTLDSNLGSEHQIDSHAYPAEVQLIAYNNQLYKSFVEASTKPHGLLGISILVNLMQELDQQAQSQPANMQINESNEQFAILVSQAAELKNRGSAKAFGSFNLSALLPESNYFVTYEGSLSTPGCYESVTWLLLNKPLYMTQSNLDSLRSISADEPSSAPSGTLIAGNIRPVQPVNNRPIRTNIRPSSRNNQRPETCKRLWTKYEYKQSAV